MNGLRTFYFSISNLKAISQHAFKIDQTTVGHRGVRAIIQIMVVDIPFLMGIGYVFGQHFETNRLADNTCCQITLGIEDITVFISIFIDDSLVLVEEFADREIDVRCF